MRFDIITLFPEIFRGYLQQSLLHKAIQAGLVGVHLHDLREWTEDKHHRVDDRPFGGGPGMILMVEPIVRAIESIAPLDPRPARIILLTPQGIRLNQQVIERLALGKQLPSATENHIGEEDVAVADNTVQPRFILLCGRYEGFDQRVIDILQPLELSIGDYILNGGEVAAMVMVDSLVRMIPGVLGDERSSIEDSFSRGNRLLEYPQYTRPREFRGHIVPEILLSGNHPEIARWREEQSLKKTRSRRADLLDQDEAS
jgi:tRNA (guanine37-N1)-methyltransferase